MLKPPLKAESYTAPPRSMHRIAGHLCTQRDNFGQFSFFGGHQSHFLLLMTFQNQGASPYLQFSFSVCNGFLRFTYGVTTADLLKTRKMQCFEIHYEMLMRLSRTNQERGKFKIRSQGTEHYVAFSDCQDTFLLRC